MEAKPMAAAATSLAAPGTTNRSSALFSRAGFGMNHKLGQCSSPGVQAFARRSDGSSSSVATRQSIPESRVSEAPEKPSSMPYKLITALSGAGALETAYLTWVKFVGGSAACPTGGCNDVLNSEYSTLFGFPLSLFGFVAYSGVALAALAVVLQTEASDSFEEEVRWFLLGCTTAMASASGFFLYLLKYKLNGASCTYCLVSAALSFSLCLSTLKGFKWKDLPRMAGLQIGVVAAVILTLSSSFAGTNAALAELDVLDLPPVEPEITTTSDSRKISLAKHLKSIGAKMYGAFWCSHCHEQKQMLGQEAMKILDYVECYPEGYGRYTRMAKACREAKVDGFPTWVIKGKSYPGELGLEDLAKVSGYTLPKEK